METKTKTHWYILTLGTIPLAFCRPFKVAIEATDIDHAAKRSDKLYSRDIYHSYPFDSGLELSDDPDDRANARCHPLPKES